MTTRSKDVSMSLSKDMPRGQILQGSSPIKKEC
jgi:hypothetical protein